ncbi:signal peptidase II [Longimicrobium sp.]|uniref:signal peptidase II n=1 Tax=Longimicrobium sp. TaxID=2029185 RepID=UPI003B3BD067
MKLSKNRWMALVIAAIVAADWATKALVQQRFPSRGDQVTLIDGLLTFQHSINHGISWGMFNDSAPNPWRLPLLILLTLIGIGATISIVRQSRDRWIHVAGALVLGGALGNLGDRVLNGGVTDFIHVHFFPYIFNVADIFISIGGVLLVARMLLDARRGDGSAPTHA